MWTWPRQFISRPSIVPQASTTETAWRVVDPVIGGLRRGIGDLIRRWNIPDGRAIGREPHEFLGLLAGPTWICLNGQDPSRTRAVTTLLHGNEPSGTRALHRFLLSEPQPATNVMALVASGEAAAAAAGLA